jgi:hypothetical protein
MGSVLVIGYSFTRRMAQSPHAQRGRVAKNSRVAGRRRSFRNPCQSMELGPGSGWMNRVGHRLGLAWFEQVPSFSPHFSKVSHHRRRPANKIWVRIRPLGGGPPGRLARRERASAEICSRTAVGSLRVSLSPPRAESAKSTTLSASGVRCNTMRPTGSWPARMIRTPSRSTRRSSLDAWL